MSSYLTQQQIQFLLNPIDPNRVRNLRGMSHMEAHDIRIHLTRVFGFGRWSQEVLSMDLIYEATTTTKNGKPALDVGYKAGVRLTINAPDGTELARYTEYAVGAHTQPEYMRGDLHDFAMKTAESQALKRCAANLGDAFGLSLYNNGYLGPVVQGTLMWGTREEQKALEVGTVPVEAEQSNLEEDDAAAPAPAAQQPAPEQAAPAPAQEQPAPQEAAQQPAAPGPDQGMSPAQAEVKDLVGRLSPADKAAFRAAWKKAGLPPGYHRLDDSHIQWIHATLDDLTKSTTGDNPVDIPGDHDQEEAAYQQQLSAQQGQSQGRQAQVEQARAHFPNAPAGELEHQFYS